MNKTEFIAASQHARGGLRGEKEIKAMGIIYEHGINGMTELITKQKMMGVKELAEICEWEHDKQKKFLIFMNGKGYKKDAKSIAQHIVELTGKKHYDLNEDTEW